MTAQRALLDAQAFYQQNLAGSWIPGYLEGRGLTQQIDSAGVGCAPAGWDNTLQYLRGCGHSDDVLVQAGLARSASGGNLIDVFRDRLTIPIRDLDHALVGFTARANPATADESTPKYLNSPGSDLFRKRELLYALGDDKHIVNSGAMPVLVEGAMDRLAIRQASQHVGLVGLANLGTALTAEHKQTLTDLIGRHRPIAFAYDSDAAGRRATVDAWNLFKEGRTINDGQLLHITLPNGVDPAALVEQGRTDELRRGLMRPRPLALTVADYQIAEAGRLDHVGKRIEVMRALLPDVLHTHRSSIAGYVTHLAGRLDLPVEDVTRETLDLLSPDDPEAAHAAVAAAADSQPAAGTTRSHSPAATASPTNQLERDSSPER